jgi:hypothetical protein
MLVVTRGFVAQKKYLVLVVTNGKPKVPFIPSPLSLFTTVHCIHGTLIPTLTYHRNEIRIAVFIITSAVVVTLLCGVILPQWSRRGSNTKNNTIKSNSTAADQEELLLVVGSGPG